MARLFFPKFEMLPNMLTIRRRRRPVLSTNQVATAVAMTYTAGVAFNYSTFFLQVLPVVKFTLGAVPEQLQAQRSQHYLM